MTLDMINHTWMVGYYSDFLISNWSFPGTYDAQQAFGNPMPLYYGVLLYPALSILALLTGADIAIRLSAALVLFLPLVSITLLARVAGLTLASAILVACVANASVYQMTNLYQRGALAEFFAIQLLLFGISIALYGMTKREGRAAPTISLGFSVLTLAFGSHPITVYSLGIFGLPLLIAASPLLIRAVPTRNLLASALLGTASVIVIAPWLLNVAYTQSLLQISTSGGLNTLFYFPTSIDSFWGRLGYFYFDTRVAIDGIAKTSTPFLDAPYSLPVACILITLLITGFSKRLSDIGLVFIPTAAVMIALIYSGFPTESIKSPGGFPGSVTAGAADGVIYRLLMPLQFAYRLAGTWVVCLALSLSIALLCLTTRTVAVESTFSRRMTLACSLLAAFAMSDKLYTTNLLFQKLPVLVAGTADAREPSLVPVMLERGPYLEIVSDTARYPFSYQSQVSYSTPLQTPLTKETGSVVVEMNVERWGTQERVNSNHPFILRTNIVPAPTNRVTINGLQALPIGLSSTGTLDFLLPPGSYQLAIERIGRRFFVNQLTICITLFWIALSLVGMWIGRKPTHD